MGSFTERFEKRKVSKGVIEEIIYPRFERIFQFSLKRTYNRIDAEDLTQEIIIEVIDSIHSLKNIESIEAWIWSIARHTYYRWLNKKSNYSTFNKIGIIDIENVNFNSTSLEDSIITESEINRLRSEICLLSKSYRDVVVLFYIEEKSCSEIAKTLNIPEGTVKRRLFEARNKIREGMGLMRNLGESSFAPRKMLVGFCGDSSGRKLLERTLPQNIALYAYREPVSMEELCIELGVSRPFMEEEVEILLKGEVLKQVGPKYQTDFIIRNKELQRVLYRVREECAAEIALPLVNKIMGFEQKIRNIGFENSDISFEELLWILIPLTIFEAIKEEDYLDLIKPPKRPNGGSWWLNGFEGLNEEDMWGGMHLSFRYYQDLQIQSKVDLFCVEQLSLMAGEPNPNEVNFLSKFIHGGIIAEQLKEEDKEQAAKLISRGFLKKRDALIVLNLPGFTDCQFNTLRDILLEVVDDFDEGIKEVYKMSFDVLKKDTPSHLNSQIYQNAFVNTRTFFANVYKFLLESKVLIKPENPSTSTKGMFLWIQKP